MSRWVGHEVVFSDSAAGVLSTHRSTPLRYMIALSAHRRVINGVQARYFTCDSASLSVQCLPSSLRFFLTLPHHHFGVISACSFFLFPFAGSFWSVFLYICLCSIFLTSPLFLCSPISSAHVYQRIIWIYLSACLGMEVVVFAHLAHALSEVVNR